MKKEVFESLRNGEIVPSLTDARKPIPEEVVILVIQKSSDCRLVEFIPLVDAVKSFNDAEENGVIAFTIPRFISWYSRRNNLNVVASGAVKWM